MYALLNVPIIN